MLPTLLPISLSSLSPAALPRAAARLVVVLFRQDFGENATHGQAICITGFHAKTFILLANTPPSANAVTLASDYPAFVLQVCNMSRPRLSPPSALTIAGSDSGGGAGIQADLDAFAAHGVHGLTVITAITAQNTRTVSAILPTPTRIVRAQLDAVFADFRVRAVKIGMLATPAIARVVGAELALRPNVKVVLDPVLVATTGARLGKKALERTLREELVPRADLVTPNIPEAEALLGRRIRSEAEMLDAAQDLIGLGARAVLLKGGHLSGPKVTDLLLARRGPQWFRHPRIDAEGHGTGCTLASAVAANLALGEPLADAVTHAIGYVHRALKAGYRPGRGRLRVLAHGVATR